MNKAPNFFCVIFLLFTTGLVSQNKINCENFYLEDIIINEEENIKELFFNLCSDLETNPKKVLEYISFYNDKNDISTDQKIVLNLLESYAYGNLSINRNSYIAMNNAYRQIENTNNKLLKAIVTAGYGYWISKFNIDSTTRINVFNAALNNLPDNEKYNEFKFFIYTEIAKNYIALKDLKKGRAYYEKATNCTQTLKDPIFYSSSSNNIALLLLQEKKYTIAEDYLKRSLSSLDTLKLHHKRFYYNVIENFGHLNKLKNNTKKSITNYKRVLNYRVKQTDTFELINIRLNIHKLLKDNYQSTNEYNVIFKENALKTNAIVKAVDIIKLNEHLITDIKQFYDDILNLDNLSSLNILSYNDYVNFLVKGIGYYKTESNRVTSDFLEIKKEQFNNSLSQKTYKNYALKQQLLILIGIILLGIAIVYFYYRKKESKYRKLINNYTHVTNENDKNKEFLLNRNKDIENIKNQFKTVLELEDELIKEIIKVSKQDQVSLNDIKSVITRHKSKVNTNLNDKLISDFEKIDNLFYKTLVNRFPNLSKSEIEICKLIRLGLSSKEIADIRKISLNSVKMNRYRIRKKMELNREDDLVLFIKEL